MHSSPLLRTIQDLSALARIRGDGDELRLLARASAILVASGITSEVDLGPLVEGPTPSASDEPVLARLRQMYEAGAWVLLETGIADLPSDLRWLFESGAVSLAQLAHLHEISGATAVVDFVELLRHKSVWESLNFGPTTEAALAHAVPRLRQAVPRLTLGRAAAVGETILDALQSHPSVIWAEPGGSLRRGDETVGDIEIVAASDSARAVFDDLIAAMTAASRCLHRSDHRLYLLTDSSQVGVRIVPPSVAGAVLLHLTGSHAHVDELHARAKRRGWTLGFNGLDRADGRPIVGRSEEEIYAALELQWVPAEIRTGGDAMRAAETGTLPSLISRRDIRGDLHVHTDYSDGRDTIDAMIEAAVALGYEYVAITDHSPHSSASRSLTVDSLRRQADDIDHVRERFPQIVILHGCEVDILPDERLDFADSILERFDIVLASLHDRAGHNPPRLLRRYLAAMRHPLVTVVTHPTNRIVPTRRGYELDYDQLFAAAVETGTVVEIDGAPTHLDLDGALARRAVLAGAMLVVDSDSHRADALGRQMGFGIQTARRGWVEARHVMNTRSIAEIRGLVAGKRSR